MRRRLELDGDDESREGIAPCVPIDIWLALDGIKAKNCGWVVFDHPTVKELKQHLASTFFLAVEADGCPVKVVLDDKVSVFKKGIEEHDIRAFVYRMEHPEKQEVGRSFFTHPFGA